MAALQWLQSNNPYYTDLQIDFETLLTYPDNSEDLLQGLHTVTVETGKDESPAATVYTEQEAETGVTYSAIPTQVPGATVREEIRRHVLGEATVTSTEGAVPGAEQQQGPEVEWPDRSGPPVDENTAGFFLDVIPVAAWLLPRPGGHHRAGPPRREAPVPQLAPSPHEPPQPRLRPGPPLHPVSTA